MAGEDLIVLKVDRARQLLVEARDATDAKQVADLARAAEVYARRQRLSEEAIAYATEVKVEALALMGEFLKAAPKNTGTPGPGRGKVGEKASPKKEPAFSPPTLAEAGISKRESSDAQALADLKKKSPDLFEQVKKRKTTVPKARREVQRQEKREELQAKAEAAPPPDEQSWRIIHGDCIAELKRLRPGSARLVFADPPYNQGVDYGDGGGADRLTDADYLSWCGQWMEAAARALAPDGSLWALISDEYADEYARLLKAAGLHRKQWLIWYESFGVCDADKKGFARSSRHLLWYVKNPRDLVFHPGAVTRDSWRLRNGDKRADPGGRTWDSVWGIDPPIPRLVGTAKERIPDFPTQLPLALLAPIVGCASDPGDLVVDPFNGSGTTGGAAIRAGRRYVGIEKQKRFFELSTLRLKGERYGHVAENGAGGGGLGQGAGRLQRPPGGDVPRDVPERDRGGRADPADESRPAVREGGSSKDGAEDAGRKRHPRGAAQPPQAGRGEAGGLTAPACLNCGADTGGLVDLPSQYHMDDDLCPADVIDCDLLALLPEGKQPTTDGAADVWLCGRCHGELLERHQAAAKEPKKKAKPKAPPLPPPAGPAVGLCPSCGVKLDDDTDSGPDALCGVCKLKARRKAARG